MNVMDRVANLLLASRGNAYCNRCIALNLTLDRQQQVQPIASALADSSSFRRCFSTCSACGRETSVIGSNTAGSSGLRPARTGLQLTDVSLRPVA
jgi:hypothetical protein